MTKTLFGIVGMASLTVLSAVLSHAQEPAQQPSLPPSRVSRPMARSDTDAARDKVDAKARLSALMEERHHMRCVFVAQQADIERSLRRLQGQLNVLNAEQERLKAVLAELRAKGNQRAILLDEEITELKEAAARAGEQPAPPAAAPPTAAPDNKLDRILQRLERIEQRLDRLEKRAPERPRTVPQ